MKWIPGFVVCAALALGGCDRDGEVPRVELPPPTSFEQGAPGMAESTAADTVADTSADGYRRYASPPDFPLPFHTLMPAEMESEPIGSGEGVGIRWTATPGGASADTATVYLFVYPENAAPQEAEETVRTIAERYGPIRQQTEVEPAVRYPWSVLEYRLDRGGTDPVRGTVALGRHANRFFHLLVQYPPAMEERFGSAVERMLEVWEWGDTGEGIGGS